MKKNIIKMVLIFTAGAATGGLGAWVVAKKKYVNALQEQWAEAQHEIAQNNEYMKQELLNAYGLQVSKDERDENALQELTPEEARNLEMVDPNTTPEEPVNPVSQTSSIIIDNVKEAVEEVSNYPILEHSEEPKQVDILNQPIEPSFNSVDYNTPDENPYVIHPDEAGQVDYPVISFTYYSDGIVENDEEETIVDNPEELFGKYALGTFGMYDDFTVFVRDDIKKVDYMINLDENTYLNTHTYQELYKDPNYKFDRNKRS